MDEDGSDKEGTKKEKGVNINRLMKNRLQKLASMTDESYVVEYYYTKYDLN